MKIGEFFVQLGVDADTKTLKDFIGDLGQLHISTLANISTIAGMANEIFKLGVEATNAAVGFQMFTNQTGLSSQELQKWQIAAVQANVSAEAVASSVSALQRSLADIKLGRGNISPYQMLGISPHGNAFEILEQLRTKMGKYDAATTTNLAAQMGITPEMINLLKLSDAEFGRLSKTVRGLTTEQEGQFLKTKQELVGLGLQFKYLGFDVAYHFVTALEQIANAIKNLHLYWPALIASVVALGVAFAPVTAAVVGLLLILDDLAVYARGGNSVFGFLEKKLGTPGTANGPVGAIGQWQKDNLPTWLTDFLVSAGSGLAGAGPPPAKSVVNNINVSVHGNGPPEATADATAKRISAAQTQLDNQGH